MFDYNKSCRKQSKLMMHYYEPSNEDQFESSQSLCRLKSIQEVFHEQSSLNNHEATSSLSLRVKVLVIRAVMLRNVKADKAAVRKYFYKWYTKSNMTLHEQAINKIVTAGKASTFRTFYFMKLLAKKQLSISHSQLIDSTNQKQNSRPSRHSGHVKTRTNSNHEKKGSTKIKSRSSDPKQRMSINNIIMLNENELVEGQNQVSRPKESISQIGAPSSLRIQMISCENLFQNSSAWQGKNQSRLVSLIEIARLEQKITNKLLFMGFRKLIENLLENDYEEELLKARRNLQLVEQNFMVECEIEALSLNYEEQVEHLDSIDKNIHALKQKFLSSQTSALVKVLCKIFYPQMMCIFPKLASSCKSDKFDSKVYEIADINPTSLTSLSSKTHSNHFLLYEKEFQDCGVNILDVGPLKSEVVKNQSKFQEQQNQY